MTLPMVTRVDAVAAGSSFSVFYPWEPAQSSVQSAQAMQQRLYTPRSHTTPELSGLPEPAADQLVPPEEQDSSDRSSQQSKRDTEQAPSNKDTNKPVSTVALPPPEPGATLELEDGDEYAEPDKSSLKRRRPLSDVDGPNTASLCCKKRRLRRFLITSRLSQPFSQPASHILNRESVASGDKRFLKIAAIMNARRIRGAMVQSPADCVWRGAMANRFRKRILVDATAGRSIIGAPVQLMNSARLILVPAASNTAARMPDAAADGTSKTRAALPVPPVVPSSRRASPRSPKLKPVRDRKPKEAATVEDYPRPTQERDEDYCAFPRSDPESEYSSDSYDDDFTDSEYGGDGGDEVYADFGQLFGASALGDDSVSEEGIDDYMDELDGIAHLPR